MAGQVAPPVTKTERQLRNEAAVRASQQPSLVQRAIAAGKRAVAIADDALVPGPKRVSDMGRDAKNIGAMMRGTKPPLGKPGKE